MAPNGGAFLASQISQGTASAMTANEPSVMAILPLKDMHFLLPVDGDLRYSNRGARLRHRA
jgi:hypothetical protein